MDERDQGFTLIELLVVIIIIGILAAIAIPVFLNQRKKGIDAGLKADIKALALVQETYMIDNPDSYGTDVAADLTAFKKTPRNVVYAAVNPTRRGYCLIARNLGDSGGGYPNYVMYDSLAGGFLNGAKFWDLTAGPVPGGVACGTGRGTFMPLP